MALLLLLLPLIYFAKRSRDSANVDIGDKLDLESVELEAMPASIQPLDLPTAPRPVGAKPGKMALGSRMPTPVVLPQAGANVRAPVLHPLPAPEPAVS